MERVIRVTLLLLTAFFAVHTSTGAITAINSREDYELCIKEMAMSLEEKRTVELAFVDLTQFKKFIKTGTCDDYASDMRYFYGSNQKSITLQFEWLDSTRVLAAAKNPALNRKVPLQTEKAAQELRKRMDRYKFKGMSRAEIVKAVYDDLILRTKEIPVQQSKTPCTNLLLRNRGYSESYCQCLFVTLTALDIPCHVLPQYNFSLMVQLDNEEWYYLIPCRSVDSISSNPFKIDENGWISSKDKWLQTYPALATENHVRLEQHETVDEFWKAAQKAYNAGNSAYGAVLARFPGKKKFMQSLDEYIAAGGMVPVEDMYLPGCAARNVYTRVMFTSEQGDVQEVDVLQNASPAKKSPKKSGKRFEKVRVAD